MCIIVAKPSGIEFPNVETMENCFLYNNDGAGYMYNDKNTVHIVKGFMHIDNFLKHYKKIISSYDKSVPFVFHFRIGTHGKKRHYSTCHPFPVSNDYKIISAKNSTCDYGLAHNGIIGTIDFQSKYSDTMEFVKNILYPLYCKYPSIEDNKEIIGNILGNHNKLAIMDKTGNIETFGEFINDKGILYSNASYKYLDAYAEDYTFIEKDIETKHRLSAWPTEYRAKKQLYKGFNRAELCPKHYDCEVYGIDCLDCVDFDHYREW